MAGYDFTAIEKKWQDTWEAQGAFRQANPGEKGFVNRPKKYVLDMFPYPSGAGLHVGHPEGYTATDIVARFWRMKGFNVLHPMGYDAFGLPAEQYAVEHGVHPRETTAANIAAIERQIRRFGFSYDWSRRVATTDPDYYRWTQWIFLKLFHSWYDEEANAARPIEELIGKLCNESYLVDWGGNLVRPTLAERLPDLIVGRPSGTTRFHELSPEQQRRLIDEYRLAYQAEVPVNWCPMLGTVLANEEVTNEGRSDRGNHPVYRRAMRQWMLRITAYADRLLEDLDILDWPEPIKIMQRNWIGRSEGANVLFAIQGIDEQIEVFTTRPDTLFGATYMVLAPEHPLVEQITTAEQTDEVRAYVEAAKNKSELERTAEAKEKTGVFTGAYATNPVNDKPIPIWVADYVMMGYGTGAIMAVPAHDNRDFEFAKQHHLPVVAVVAPDKAWAGEHRKGVRTTEDSDRLIEAYRVAVASQSAAASEIAAQLRAGGLTPEITRQAMRDAYIDHPLWFDEAFCGEGVAVHSGKYDGLTTAEFKEKITADLEADGLGKAAVNYKLRDWLFSRQRYWGEPFPIVHCEACGTVALGEHELPLLLPEMENFSPEASDDPAAPPRPPLARATDWARTPCPVCGRPGRRELNTMPQWAGSCWYFLRFLDARNDRDFCGTQASRYWMAPSETNPAGGVDLYVGGAEHAVLHLLYSRFWHKVLYDLGRVSTSEPFGKLFNQGMIRSFAYRDGRGVCVGYDDVDLTGDKPRHKKTGEVLTETVEKMSKSLKNVINPDEVIAQYGADTFRLYEMFLGPLEASKPWNTRDVPGVHRFLHRVWRMVLGNDETAALLCEAESEETVERALHKLIKKVGEDIEAMKFNTAIAAMMEFVNAVFKAGRVARDQAERFVLVLAPFAPHLAEEVWQRLGHTQSLAAEAWPRYDEKFLAEAMLELPVQVNGKLRGRISVPADANQAAVLSAAKADEKVAAAIAGKQVVKEIVVPGRLVNLVVK